MGTQVNIFKLKKVLQGQKVQNRNVVFIDLKSAYNTVNREMLADILVSKAILSEKETEFLMTLYDELHIYTGVAVKEKVYLKNGLHQGSILSPYLFNIYFNKVQEVWGEEIQKMKDSDFWKKKNKRKWRKFQEDTFGSIYADDVAIVARKEIIGDYVDCFRKACEKYELVINWKKTVYMARTKSQRLEEMGIERVMKFKYLGIWLNNQGGMADHYKALKGIILKNATKIKKLFSFLPCRFLLKIWKVYIKPHFDYATTAIFTESKSWVDKWDTLYRMTIKRAFGIPKAASTEFMDEVFGGIAVSNRMWKWMDMCQERDKANREFEIRVNNLKNRVRKKRLEEKIGEEMTKLDDFYMRTSHKMMQDRLQLLTNTKSGVLRKWDNKRVRMIPNRGFFDQWRFVAYTCKEHQGQHLTLEHMSQFHTASGKLYDICIKLRNEIRFADTQLWNAREYNRMNRQGRDMGEWIRKIVNKVGIKPIRKVRPEQL